MTKEPTNMKYKYTYILCLFMTHVVWEHGHSALQYFIDSAMWANSLVATIPFLLPVHYNLSRWHHFFYINGFHIDNMQSMKRLWCFMCNTDNKNFLFWIRNTLGFVTSENWWKKWFALFGFNLCLQMWRNSATAFCSEGVLSQSWASGDIWSLWPEVHRRAMAFACFFVNVCSLEAVLQPSVLECAPMRVLRRWSYFLPHLSFLAHFLPFCYTSYILFYGMGHIDKSSTSI